MHLARANLSIIYLGLHLISYELYAQNRMTAEGESKSKQYLTELLPSAWECAIVTTLKSKDRVCGMFLYSDRSGYVLELLLRSGDTLRNETYEMGKNDRLFALTRECEASVSVRVHPNSTQKFPKFVYRGHTLRYLGGASNINGAPLVDGFDITSPPNK